MKIGRKIINQSGGGFAARAGFFAGALLLLSCAAQTPAQTFIPSHTVWEDEQGRTIEESYGDEDGNLLVNPEKGYALIRYAYDTMGNISDIRFYGADAEPIDVNGAAIIHRTFDRAGNITAQLVYTAEGKIVSPAEGCDYIERRYDLAGNITRETFRKADGTAVQVNGYATVTTDYEQTEEGTTVTLQYFDIDGKPAEADGFVSTVRSLDADGLKVYELRLRAGTADIRRGSDYASVGIEFDEEGQPVCETFFDIDGEPLSCGGYAIIRREFNSAGYPVLEAYYDESGGAVLLEGGYHAVRREYDEQGNVIREQYYDKKKQPVMTAEGYAQIIRLIDEDGAVKAEKWFDTEGKEIVR